MNKPSFLIKLSLVIVVFLVALLPRVIDLGTIMTVDEHRWLWRSYWFTQAVQEGDWVSTNQTTHPGVTTMWLAGSGMAAKVTLSSLFGEKAVFGTAAIKDFLFAAKLPFVLATSLLVVMAFLFLRHFLSPIWALLAVLFIAWDPFLIAHSRVVHVDALLSMTMFVSALSFLVYLKKKRVWYLVGAAILGTLAVLTKMPALFLLPFFALAYVVWNGRGFFSRQKLITFARDVLIIIIVGGVVWFALWPAMWAEPFKSVQGTSENIRDARTVAHNISVEDTQDKWFYVRAIFFNSTPLTLILTIVALVSLMLPRVRRHLSSEKIRLVILALIYVLAFVIMVTLAVKRGDRYLLPAFPMFNLLAFFGLAILVSVFGKTNTIKKALWGASIVLLAVFGLMIHPYYLSAYNTLLPAPVERRMGWGEGLEQAAQYLNEKLEEDLDITVAAWYPLVFDQSFEGKKTFRVTEKYTDYLVLYKAMLDRPATYWTNPVMEEYHGKVEPEKIIMLNGLEYVWIYHRDVPQKLYQGTVGEITGDKKIGQTFKAERDGLSGVRILMANYQNRENTEEVVVKIMKSAGTAQELYRVTVNASQIQDNEYRLFSFSPIQDSGGREYFLEITSPSSYEGNAVTVRANSDSGSYADGQLFIAGEVVEGDLGFELVYDETED